MFANKLLAKVYQAKWIGFGVVSLFDIKLMKFEKIQCCIVYVKNHDSKNHDSKIKIQKSKSARADQENVMRILGWDIKLKTEWRIEKR